MSKYSTLLIPILNEILLGEIGEANIPPLKWKKHNKKLYTFEIELTHSNESVDVEFESMSVDNYIKYYYLPKKLWKSKNTWNISYSIGGNDEQFTKSNLKVLLQILSTVVDIVKDFVSNQDPDALYILATEKNETKTQKSHLYDAYLKKLLSHFPNYHPESRRKGILLVKK